MTAQLFRPASILLLSLASVHSLLAQDNCPRPRQITAIGTFETTVPPDEVLLALGIETHDKDLTVAKANNDSIAKKVLSLAHTAGIEAKNIQTSALNMGPEYSEERVPKLIGYKVSQAISFRLTDLSQYEDLMTASLKAGANRVYGISFTLTDPKKYKEEARLKAIQAAREKASTMAAELGQKLGLPLEVFEGGGSDSLDLPVNGRNFMDLAMVEPGVGAQPTIAGGVVTIRASVRVTFQLE